MSGEQADPPKAELIERLDAAFSGLVPHNRALGLKLVDFDREQGMAMMSLPYRAELVGNPDTGVIHGGAITSLLDACSGASVFTRMWSETPVATLDLRIDYLKPATPGHAVLARAICYKMTKNVAFVRANAFHEASGEDDPVATAAGTFIITHRGTFTRMDKVSP